MRLAGVAARANSGPYLQIEKLTIYYFYLHRANCYASRGPLVRLLRQTYRAADATRNASQWMVMFGGAILGLIVGAVTAYRVAGRMT
jgi:predicted LPLAT superfamily acyltransferase